MKRLLTSLAPLCLGASSLAACSDATGPRAPAPEIESVVLKDSLIGGDPLDADASSVRSVAVAGRVAEELTSAGTLVHLYEHRSERGYFVMVSEGEGAFRIEDVLVNMEDNCVQLYSESPDFETPRMTRDSLDGFYVFTLEQSESSTAVRWEQQETGACASG